MDVTRMVLLWAVLGSLAGCGNFHVRVTGTSPAYANGSGKLIAETAGALGAVAGAIIEPLCKTKRIEADSLDADLDEHNGRVVASDVGYGKDCLQ